MSVPIQPLADYIVAQTEEATTKTASGLYIPGNAQEKPTVAKVVAVAAGVKSIKVGDRIIYKSYSQTEVKVDKEAYLLVKEEDVLALVGGRDLSAEWSEKEALKQAHIQARIEKREAEKTGGTK